ncbi:putative aldehyde dehydrogenase (NAD(+)) [Medicago truncatula]|uniref:Putative aldehyde dehydrogenase (NAD(+)) n=1 Tax=Medicago truncatula TaxID=3880 RepID=A0A396JML5_MEDTR|nr:putative aldehyde dehydrogenase (NAD(+)) [Medicago truncatula]
MASSKLNKKVFDLKEASTTVKDLRITFDSGKTRSYEWKVSQLKALLELTEKHEKEIVEALYSDLSKSEAESFIQEVLNFSQYYFTIFVVYRNLSAPSFLVSVFVFISLIYMLLEINLIGFGVVLF